MSSFVAMFLQLLQGAVAEKASCADELGSTRVVSGALEAWKQNFD